MVGTENNIGFCEYGNQVHNISMDPNQRSNLDRLIGAITAKDLLSSCSKRSGRAKTDLESYFEAYREASIMGLRVELLNEMTLGSEIFTFLPSLSAIYLSYDRYEQPTG